MVRPFAAGLLAVLLASCVTAQVPDVSRLRYPNGGTLAYRVEYATTQAHSIKGDKTEARSVVKVTRLWKVEGVDGAGTATLAMSLADMQQERTTTAGSMLKFDSNDVAGSTLELRGMAKHIGPVLAVARVDALGKVVEVTKGDPSAFELEPPFIGTLPGTAMKPGTAWERAFKVVLAPPVGTGEKYDAVQKFSCTAVKDGMATVAVVTVLKDKPKAAADMIPLWQMLPKGELVWDLATGRLLEARLAVDEELKDHDGPGSHTKFASVKTIKLIKP